jgi:hypothetical protein
MTLRDSSIWSCLVPGLALSIRAARESPARPSSRLYRKRKRLVLKCKPRENEERRFRICPLHATISWSVTLVIVGFLELRRTSEVVKGSFAAALNGLVNETAYSRLAGSTRLFVFGYVTDVDATTVHAVPYIIGDLVNRSGGLPMRFLQTLELRPEDIGQFVGMDEE